MAGLAIAVASCTPAIAETPEGCFFRRTNEERAKADRPLLARSSAAADVAERHSRRMAIEETIFHNNGQPPDDSVSIADELEPYRWVGENVGMGRNCDAVFVAFLSSPGHKANLLDLDYKQLGVGVTTRGDTIYASLSFYTPARVQRKPTARPTPPRRECP